MSVFELSSREEAVVALLALGHTDAGVARELRISERSVSNILRSLMDRLGVENRFQLGIALGTLRAVPVPPNAVPPSAKAVPPSATVASPDEQ
jgi:LuxR family transcriptional regulator, transcriptional regulator of spore coat protein